MRDQVRDISFTKASSKGQVVIPTVLRKRLGIKQGTVFSVAARKDMIVLKKIDAKLSEQDLKSLKLIEEAWNDIEQGRYRVMSKQSFLNELKEW
ncbi:hypothetical protein E6H12_07030 [Candidatus Bathyarchaeota archaeon]|nr:MAG: hypothetical protein E6H12_07030 [Candidatus Bathyarchaeota archaeon]